MATVTIKIQNSLNWYIWFTSTSYQCWLNPLKTQAIFIIFAVLVIKRVQRVLPKLHAKHATIRTLTVTYGTLQKNKRYSVLNLPKQRQACLSLFFQFNMPISVIYGTLSVLCKRVVSMLSPLASNSCRGSHIRQFHVLVVKWRQRNVQKGMMHMQSCCFAYLNPLLFCRHCCHQQSIVPSCHYSQRDLLQ